MKTRVPEVFSIANKIAGRGFLRLVVHSQPVLFTVRKRCMSDSRDLEILVAQIQKQLSPEAEVVHNVKLPGRNSGSTRQIDVLVRQRIGQYEMNIVIDSKDYKNPVDVKGVEEFHGLIDDVGANKGVLVCPGGFTKGAKNRAAKYLIDLFRPIDTGNHKWKVGVRVPAICDFRKATISFGIEHSEPMYFSLPMNFHETLEVQAGDGSPLGKPLNAAISRWNAGNFPIDVGKHERLDLFPGGMVKVDNGQGQLTWVRIYVSLRVSSQLFFGQVPLSKVSGFVDVKTDLLHTNGFEVDVVSPGEVFNKWQKVAETEELPAKPVLRFNGLVGWSAS